MKRVIKLAALATALVPMYFTMAKAEKLESVEIGKTSAITFTQDINASRWQTLSVQTVYSDGTPAVHSIADGAKSTATVTVSNPTLLVSTRASVSIYVSSPSQASGDSITLNGVVFTEGTDWAAVTSTVTSAANLAAKIDAHPDFVATAQGGSTITVTYVEYGTAGNGLTVATSDSQALGKSAATFAGGINRYMLSINGVTLTEGVDWFASAGLLSSGTAVSSHTAISIRNAINANASLSLQVVASSPTAPTSAINVTAIRSGNLGYYLSASTTALATTGFSQGLAPEFDVDTDIFTKSAHGLTTGMKVLFSTGTSTVMSMTGLANGTTYFAIKLADDMYALATTSTTAAAGTKINISSNTGSGATFRMTPNVLTTAAGNGFFWSVSNDGVNYSTYAVQGVSISSITYSAAGSQIWDFGAFAYKYLRFNFFAPSAGGINLTVKAYGKKEN